MKKASSIAILIVFAAFILLGKPIKLTAAQLRSNQILATAAAEIVPAGLTDDELITYTQTAIQEAIENDLQCDDIIVTVDTRLQSKEYLKSLAANSRENVYFGFTDRELKELFGDKSVIFDIDENGATRVIPYEERISPLQAIIQDVAVGSAVILTSVTISLATAGTSGGCIPIIHAIFTAAASGGAIGGISGGLISGISSAVITAIQTGDMQQARDAFIVSSAKGYRSGAFIGSVTGGVKKALEIMRISTPTWQDSENAAKAQFGGESQQSYLNGEKVSKNTPGSTRPDLMRTLSDGTMEALEVKNYNLGNSARKSALLRTIKHQVTERVSHLPAGTKQAIVLDTRGKLYSQAILEKIVREIKAVCEPDYSDITVSFLRY